MIAAALCCPALIGCGSASEDDDASDGAGTGSEPPTTPSCDAADQPSSTVAAPVLRIELADEWHEAWLGSPAVADLDNDGVSEAIVARGGLVIVWRADGSVLWRYDTGEGRIWASPAVADLDNDGALEIAVAARDKVFVLEADGSLHGGSPMVWEDELRGLAVGQLDGDADLEIVVSVGHGGPTDVIQAFDVDGGVVPGFPPQAAGTANCSDGKCYLAGCYDQNVALGDLDGDGRVDIVAPHDNAYASFHESNGEAFDAAPGFAAIKTPGVRYLHDLAEAQMGYAEDEESANQAHFTNTAPAIADIDGDGDAEIIMVGSVQNAAQSDRERGVALWVVGHDATRAVGFETPVHMPDFIAGLWDYDGTNVVGLTNQVSVGDVDAEREGLEMVFAGFDGRVHAVAASGETLWSYSYTTDDRVLTGGIAIADLSGDGIPELVFASYSPDPDKSALFVLDAGGNLLHRIDLPGRGAMPVPTVADLDGNGLLEILVSLKDAESGIRAVQVYEVPGSAANCLIWPTGRGSLRRDGWLPS